MVRLVFRPYTQIPRWICTSESLRASTRVSPGFTLFRNSSPPFGSQHVCSHSNLSSEECWPADSARRSYHCHFHCARDFANPVLAHMLDSLVRVSRRVEENHLVRIAKLHIPNDKSVPPFKPRTSFLSKGHQIAGQSRLAKRGVTCHTSIKSKV